MYPLVALVPGDLPFLAVLIVWGFRGEHDDRQDGWWFFAVSGGGRQTGDFLASRQQRHPQPRLSHPPVTEQHAHLRPRRAVRGTCISWARIRAEILRPFLCASDAVTVRHTRVPLCNTSSSVFVLFSRMLSLPNRNRLSLPRACPHHTVILWRKLYFLCTCNGERDNRSSCIRPTPRCHADASVHSPATRTRNSSMVQGATKMLSSSLDGQYFQTTIAPVFPSSTPSTLIPPYLSSHHNAAHR